VVVLVVCVLVWDVELLEEFVLEEFEEIVVFVDENVVVVELVVELCVVEELPPPFPPTPGHGACCPLTGLVDSIIETHVEHP